MEIEGHLRDYGSHKKRHFTAIQSMHHQILDCKGIIFHSDYLDRYDDFFISFLQTVRIKDENHKRDGYRIIKQYATEFYKQIFAPLTDIRIKEVLLNQTKFLSEVTEQLLSDFADYHDSVREECQLLLVCITSRYLPPKIEVDEHMMELQQILKSNIKSGWPNAMNGQLKEAAFLETGMVRYLFKDVSAFLHKLITIFMDESHGRDNVLKFFKLLNVVCPMLLLNDYRVSKQSAALRRVELIEKLV